MSLTTGRSSESSLQQSAAYQELVQALQNPGCPICAIAQRQARTHISGILWDSVTDPSSRARLDASLGLCGRHSREMLTFAGERLAISIVQQAVVRVAGQQLEDAPPPPRRSLLDNMRRTLDGWLGRPTAGEPVIPAHNPSPPAYDQQPPQPRVCPACEIEARTEERVAQVLIRHFIEDLDKPVAQAGGLCRPHLYFCLSRSDAARHAALLQIHAQLWQELYGHLAEFIRKRDHRFSHEPITDAERDAVERSVLLMTGGDPLYPPRKDPRK